MKSKKAKRNPSWRDRAAEIGRRIASTLRGPTPVPVPATAASRRR